MLLLGFARVMLHQGYRGVKGEQQEIQKHPGESRNHTHCYTQTHQQRHIRAPAALRLRLRSCGPWNCSELANNSTMHCRTHRTRPRWLCLRNCPARTFCPPAVHSSRSLPSLRTVLTAMPRETMTVQELSPQLEEGLEAQDSALPLQPRSGQMETREPRASESSLYLSHRGYPPVDAACPPGC